MIATYELLVQHLGHEAAKMLCQKIADGSYAPLPGVSSLLAELHQPLLDELDIAQREKQEMMELLKDPIVVHSNMIRGIISPITHDMWAHVEGQDAVKELYEFRKWQVDRIPYIELEKEISSMVTMLENGEWAEHAGKSELGRRLEDVITKMLSSTATLIPDDNVALLRDALRELYEAVGGTAGSEPDVYADYDKLSDMLERSRAALQANDSANGAQSNYHQHKALMVVLERAIGVIDKITSAKIVLPFDTLIHVIDLSEAIDHAIEAITGKCNIEESKHHIAELTAGCPIAYLRTVPDHCDRIVWRGRYLYLKQTENKVELSDDESS